MHLSPRRLAMLREMGVPWRALPRRKVADAAGVAQAEVPVLAPMSGPGAASGIGMRPGPGAKLLPAIDPGPESGSNAELASIPGVAVAPDVASLDWPALREAVTACRACGLCETRKQTVFGVGHPQAHWMIVGEAPGEQEDLQGEPFVGAAGRLLDQMLRSVGLTRAEQAPEGLPPLQPAQQVYIANTLKCRPPRNRNPEPQELQRCEPFLVRQIELLRPRVILAMGRFAVQSLLRTDEPIGRLRGRVHRYQGVPLVVTYHPAYLLRNLPDKAKAWEDLCLALDTMDRLRDPAPAPAPPLQG